LIIGGSILLCLISGLLLMGCSGIEAMTKSLNEMTDKINKENEEKEKLNNK